MTSKKEKKEVKQVAAENVEAVHKLPSVNIKNAALCLDGTVPIWQKEALDFVPIQLPIVAEPRNVVCKTPEQREKLIKRNEPLIHKANELKLALEKSLRECHDISHLCDTIYKDPLQVPKDVILDAMNPNVYHMYKTRMAKAIDAQLRMQKNVDKLKKRFASAALRRMLPKVKKLANQLKSAVNAAGGHNRKAAVKYVLIEKEKEKKHAKVAISKKKKEVQKKKGKKSSKFSF